MQLYRFNRARAGLRNATDNELLASFEKILKRGEIFRIITYQNDSGHTHRNGNPFATLTPEVAAAGVSLKSERSGTKPPWSEIRGRGGVPSSRQNCQLSNILIQSDGTQESR